MDAAALEKGKNVIDKQRKFDEKLFSPMLCVLKAKKRWNICGKKKTFWSFSRFSQEIYFMFSSFRLSSTIAKVFFLFHLRYPKSSSSEYFMKLRECVEMGWMLWSENEREKVFLHFHLSMITTSITVNVVKSSSFILLEVLQFCFAKFFSVFVKEKRKVWVTRYLSLA